MSVKEFNVVFEKIKNVTGISDIGYHEIRDGMLHPVYKTSTDTLDLEKWRSTHSQHPVLIDKTEILKQIVGQRRPAIVNDVNSDKRSADAFFLFGIDSILIVPVIEKEVVTGIYCIASIGKLHNFTEEEANKCEEIINASRLSIPYGEGVRIKA
ncbi:MAG: GAF domain-containing protein [Clostridiaceae bacterium]|nr:GAF domain-containing protein [Clostridiaceae bacterium]